jgi:hypothetical protein
LPAEQFSRLGVDTGKHGENENLAIHLPKPIADRGLAKVVKLWPKLTASMRAKILRLAERGEEE